MVVVGGSGFIGKVLVKKLKAKSASRRETLSIDLQKPKTLAKLKKFSVIIHCAAKVNYTWLPWFQIYKKLYQTNVEGTKNLLKTVTPKYFVFLSTLAVYNSQKLKVLKPRSFYGLTKYLAELKCKEYAKKKKFKLLIIRLPMVYDVREPKREAWLFKKFGWVLQFLRPLLKKKKIRVISRKKAINLICSLIKKRKEGVVDIKGNLIDLSHFLDIMTKNKK